MTITSKKQMAHFNKLPLSATVNLPLDREIYSHVIEMYISATAPKLSKEIDLSIEMNPQQRFVADVLMLANLSRSSGVSADENWQSQIIMAGINVLYLESERLDKRGDLESRKLSGQCMLSCASLCKSAQFILVDGQTKALVRAIQRDALNSARCKSSGDIARLIRYK